ncbi:hypothetical protein DERP_003593 [Dermatophagoides pteronyssinus]|uniref:Uncharacterized protein n=1 Tax=Dermatophagoides pteronyssinus TaxID=6956 RepID=A0ABQ8JLL4_DERPT|nr:hypothetical protein DERP_003593 [Dermatophagoides pteronyssinus]
MKTSSTNYNAKLNQHWNHHDHDDQFRRQSLIN